MQPPGRSILRVITLFYLGRCRIAFGDVPKGREMVADSGAKRNCRNEVAMHDTALAGREKCLP